MLVALRPNPDFSRIMSNIRRQNASSQEKKYQFRTSRPYSDVFKPKDPGGSTSIENESAEIERRAAVQINKKFKSLNAIECIEEEDEAETAEDDDERNNTANRSAYTSTNGSPASGYSSSKQSSILIADDTVYNLEVMKHYLRESNLKIESCFDGTEAIRLVMERRRKRRRPFSLILLNCTMPWKSGFQTSKELRRLMQRSEIKYCPIIGFSANPSYEYKVKRIKAGMVDFIQLPYTQMELRRKVSKWTGLRP